MKTVYKYTIPFLDEAVLELPIGAEVLSVGTQHEQLMLWARIDTESTHTTVKRRFRVVGTGHPEAVGRFIGTVLFRDGTLVFHVFVD